MKIAVLKGSPWSKISGIKGHSHELFLVSSRLKVERTRDSSKLTQAQTSVECQNYQNFQLRFLPQNSIQNFTHIHFLYFYTLYFYNVIYIVVIFSSINFIRTYSNSRSLGLCIIILSLQVTCRTHSIYIIIIIIIFVY